MKNLWNQPLAKGASVELRLETDMQSFKNSEPDFIASLATALEIHPDEIRKIGVLRGCVRYIVDIPKEAAAKFKKALTSNKLSSDMKELFLQYNIDWRDIKFNVTKEAPYIKKINQVAEEMNRDGRTLTWLHLSDVHFVDKPGALKWNQDLIKEDLISRLPKLLSSWELDPNLLFFTGDIAFSAQQEEYSIAKDFFAQLRRVLGTGLRTYIVPGNHDVSWNRIGKLDAKLRERLATPFEVSDYLLNPAFTTERERDFTKFSNYFEFANEQHSQLESIEDQQYFYMDQFKHLGLKVGVAGLNSAWRSTKKPDRPGYDLDMDQLLLGEPQVMTTLKSLEGSQIRFGLLHHPPGSQWFKDFDRKMQDVFLPKFDFVLRGHEHQVVTDARIDIMTEDNYVHIGSGALYDASEFKRKTGYPISFNAVRLNLDTGKGILFFWRYFTDLYKWTRDVIADDGMKIFDIPQRVLDRVRNLPPNHTPNARAATAGRK
jgi:predicted MPP superfamily phosphohydrolase